MGKGKVLKVYDTKCIFENLESGTCLYVTLNRDGHSKEMHQVAERHYLPDTSGSCQVVPFEAIFGFYDLLSSSYVALLIESEPYVNANNIVIRKAKKIIVIPMFRQQKFLSESKQNDEAKYLLLLLNAFAEHIFFYSLTFDLTLTQQRIAKHSLTTGMHKLFSGNDSLWARADDRFFWNRDVIQDLKTCEACEWIVPFMSAFIEFKHECVTDNDKFALLFISRRSRFRQGCRFTRRGLDEHGSAANFVETEQIIIFPDGKISSYVQIRGSIPLHWSSPVSMKYDPAVNINDDISESKHRAEKHINEILNLYSDNVNDSNVVFVNLIDMKKDQLRLGVAFKDLIESFKDHIFQPLYYVWFDFHHECKKKGKWKNLANLANKVDELFRLQRYFSKTSSGEVLSWQIGVIRTNCMDNLDRTNVAQSIFARRSLIMQLGCVHVLNDPAYTIDSPWKSFEKVYKSVWANNANAISMLYAGTGALKVDFTKTGKRTVKGMFNDGVNSCMRYYINNFTDGYKQDAIDLLLGTFRPDQTRASPFTPPPGHESFSAFFIRGFVLIMFIFIILIIITDVLSRIPVLGDIILSFFHVTGRDCLGTHLCSALGLSSVFMGYVSYLIVKKGSHMGEQMVVRPHLVVELAPNTKILQD